MRDLGEALEAHHAREHRRAVDPVVIEEALPGRVELGQIRSPSPTVIASIRPVIGPCGSPSSRAAGRVEPARGMALGCQRPEGAGDQHLAARAGGLELTAQRGDADLRRQHVDPGLLHHLRDRPAAGHADLRPRGPVDGDRARRAVGLQPRDALAHQVVGGAVVGLAGVAEPASDRAEHGRGADLRAAQRAQHVEPAVGLDVEHQVVLALRLLGEVVADLQAGAVQQHVDGSVLADGFERGRDLVGVGEIDRCQTARAPLGSIAAIATSRRAPARSGQLALDELRRRALAGGLSRSARSRASPSRSRPAARGPVGRVGRGCEVEQVEGPRRRARRDRR